MIQGYDEKPAALARQSFSSADFEQTGQGESCESTEPCVSCYAPDTVCDILKNVVSILFLYGGTHEGKHKAFWRD